MMQTYLKVMGLFSALTLAPVHAQILTLQFLPKQPLVLSNTLNKDLSAYCLVNASDLAINTLAIYLYQGSGAFNGTSIKQGQTMYQNIKNQQMITLKASSNAAAKITNTGDYVIQASCYLG